MKKLKKTISYPLVFISSMLRGYKNKIYCDDTKGYQKNNMYYQKSSYG